MIQYLDYIVVAFKLSSWTLSICWVTKDTYDIISIGQFWMLFCNYFLQSYQRTVDITINSSCSFSPTRFSSVIGVSFCFGVSSDDYSTFSYNLINIYYLVFVFNHGASCMINLIVKSLTEVNGSIFPQSHFIFLSNTKQYLKFSLFALIIFTLLLFLVY